MTGAEGPKDTQKVVPLSLPTPRGPRCCLSPYPAAGTAAIYLTVSHALPHHQRWQAPGGFREDLWESMPLGLHGNPTRLTCHQLGYQHLNQGRKYSQRLSAAEDEQACHVPSPVGSAGMVAGVPRSLVDVRGSAGSPTEAWCPWLDGGRVLELMVFLASPGSPRFVGLSCLGGF